MSSEFGTAFVQALAEMPDIHKDKQAEIETKKGGVFRYAYADLASIISLVRPVLAKHGLAVAQAVDTLHEGTVSVTTRVYHSSGHSETFGTLTIPAGDDARRTGSAVTYARRYSLCAALGIAPDEDTDGAEVSGSNAPAKTRPVDKQQHALIGSLIGEIAALTPGIRSKEDWTNDSRRWVKDNFGKTSRADLTYDEAEELIKYLRGVKALQDRPFG